MRYSRHTCASRELKWGERRARKDSMLLLMRSLVSLVWRSRRVFSASLLNNVAWNYVIRQEKRQILIQIFQKEIDCSSRAKWFFIRHFVWPFKTMFCVSRTWKSSLVFDPSRPHPRRPAVAADVDGFVANCDQLLEEISGQICVAPRRRRSSGRPLRDAGDL